MSYFVDETELYHHGILGQKWGVRRYQNKDGSLTRLGKKHWEMLDDDTVNRERNRAINTGDLKTIKKHRDRFSADEIDRAIRQKNANEKLKYEMSRKGKKEKKEAEEEAKKALEARKFADKMNTVSNTIGSVANTLGRGSDAYNNFAKVSNSLFGTSFKYIKEKQEKEPTKWSMDKLMKTKFENLTSEELAEIGKVVENSNKLMNFHNTYGKYGNNKQPNNSNNQASQQPNNSNNQASQQPNNSNNQASQQPNNSNNQAPQQPNNSNNQAPQQPNNSVKKGSAILGQKWIKTENNATTETGKTEISKVLSSPSFSGSSIKAVSTSQNYKTGSDYLRSLYSDYDSNRDYYDSRYYYDHSDEVPFLKK